MTSPVIEQYEERFSKSFSSLNVHITYPQVESLAVIVHSSMENKKRIYHTSKHTLTLCEAMNPLQTFAALFHDIVYYQVDGDLPELTKSLLQSILKVDGETITLKPTDQEDTGLNLCMAIFGYTSSQTLPANGMNEFLSAVVATKLLAPYLKKYELITIVACIEATIPFRGNAQDGQSHPLALEGRIRQLLSANDLPIDTQVATIMESSVRFANRDLESFAVQNTNQFLSTTWQLIQEQNALTHSASFESLIDLRNALLQMEQFFKALDPDSIFLRYANVPTEKEWGKMTAFAESNLHLAAEYLGVKLASIAVLEAIALETGGNCPISMLLGNTERNHDTTDSLKYCYPRIKVSTDINQKLLQALYGDAENMGQALTASQFSAWIYCTLGHLLTFKTLFQAKRMFDGDLSAIDFLKGLEPVMLETIMTSCAKVNSLRKEALITLQARLINQEEKLLISPMVSSS